MKLDDVIPLTVQVQMPVITISDAKLAVPVQ